MKWTFCCLVIVLIQTIFVQTAQAAVSVDTAAKSIENTQIKIMYAPGNSVEEGLTMDAIGNGFASYSLESATSFTIKESATQYANVNVKRTNNVDIEENLRVYDHLPLLEIEYVKFNNALWFEDFYTKVAEPRVYSIYGIPTEVDGAKQQQWETAANQAAGHNYESFPNFGSPTIVYPWKRYVFLLTEGREQLFTVGKRNSSTLRVYKESAGGDNKVSLADYQVWRSNI